MLKVLRLFVVTALAALCCAPAAEAAFPGENGKILFVRSSEDYGSYQFQLMDPDGSNVESLGVGGANSTTDPEWSPDGSQFVYRGYDPGAVLIVRRADGTLVTTIRPNHSRVDHPAWSPDGKRLVYDFDEVSGCQFQFCFGYSGLAVINLDGTGDTEIATWDGFSVATDPAWSPDGRRIAFVGPAFSGAGGDIWVMNADGSGRGDVSSSPDPEERPAWSPDGRRITFERWVDANFNIEVFVMDADGGNQVNVTRNTIAQGNPAWSPDGNWIVFTGVGALYKIRPDGTQETRLSSPGHDGQPDWQPIVNRAPDCSAVGAAPGSIWPPNHKLVLVSLSGATDPDGDAVALTVTSLNGGDGVLGPSPNEARLRADKGATYAIAFSASDGHGGTCTGEVDVAVSHPD